MGFWKYVKAAFHEKAGMPVPVSWAIIAFTAVLGFLDSGFLLIGAGVLAAYVFFLASSSRFQRVVDGKDMLGAQTEQMDKVGKQLTRLDGHDRLQYSELVERCNAIVSHQSTSALPDELTQQAVGLSRLAGFYLQLLVSRAVLRNVPNIEDMTTLAGSRKSIEQRLADPAITDQVKHSLEQQLEILKQRQETRLQAASRLEYIEAELQRIEQQVELLREQSLAESAPSGVSYRIDAVASTLSDTSQWMKQHRETIGDVEDVLSTPPPIIQVQKQ